MKVIDNKNPVFPIFFRKGRESLCPLTSSDMDWVYPPAETVMPRIRHFGVRLIRGIVLYSGSLSVVLYLPGSCAGAVWSVKRIPGGQRQETDPEAGCRIVSGLWAVFSDVPPDMEVPLPDCWLPELPAVPVPPAVVLSPFSGRPVRPVFRCVGGAVYQSRYPPVIFLPKRPHPAKYLPQSLAVPVGRYFLLPAGWLPQPQPPSD